MPGPLRHLLIGLAGLVAATGLVALGDATDPFGLPGASAGEAAGGGPSERPPASEAPSGPAPSGPVPSASVLSGLVTPGHDFVAAEGDRLAIGGLCLSERSEQDDSGLVLLRSCDLSFPPRRLEPYGGAWRVTTRHPVFGPGCMGVPKGNTASGPPASDNFCGDVQLDRFLLRRVSGGYLLQPEGRDRMCLGVAGEPRSGVSLRQLLCDEEAPGQLFTIDRS